MLMIRADGNAKIGVGHLMRCLTIAEAVRDAGRSAEDAPGAEILFLCADEDSASLAEQHGFRAAVLHTDYRQMDTEPEWTPWITGQNNTILVDSYFVTEKYLRRLQRYGRTFLMDDLQERAYPVQGVINYNLFAAEDVYGRLYGGRGAAARMIFALGGRYIPLRRAFRESTYRVRDEVRDVLITTGGGDADNIAGAILHELYDPQTVFHVLVGRFNPHYEAWTARAQRTDNLCIHHDVQDMAGLMRACDLAVTAGGSTVYELCAVGVPFICFSYAKNQEALVDYMRDTAAAGSAGAWHKDAAACLARIHDIYNELCGDAEKRKQYFARERVLVDGLGAQRLAEVLMSED